MIDGIRHALGNQADSLLDFSSPKIPRSQLHVPGPDFVDRIFVQSDRNVRVLANLHRLHHTGRLAGTDGDLGRVDSVLERKPS